MPLLPSLDIDNVSGIDALDALHDYYKMALRTFTDNGVRKAVKWHLLRGLENVFSLEEAAGWEDAKVSMAAAESMNVMNLRAQLKVMKAKSRTRQSRAEEFMLVIEEIVMAKGAPRGCNRGE
jgi:hypothetical protein